MIGAASSDRAKPLGWALAAFAAAVVAFQLSRPGLLFGMTPDIAVYLGASVRLVHGALPYRDFVLVQPPGFTLLATPFGWLSEATGTRDALAALRLCTPLLAAANTALAVRITSRLGAAPMLLAGAIAALFPPELYALRAGLLEPVVNVLCLAGLAVLFQAGTWPATARTIAVAGFLFGVAGSVKLTAIVPAAAVLLLAATRPRARLLPFAAGAAAGFLVPALPFLVTAPGSFYADVFASQLRRVAGGHPAIYPQYPAVLLPLLAPAAALVVSRLRPVTWLASGSVVAYLLVSQLSALAALAAPDIARTVDAAVPAGACAISDKPRMLVTTDRFQSTRAGCTAMVDPYGTMLTLGRRDPIWKRTFAKVDYVVTDTPIAAWYVAPDAALQAYVAQHFRLESRDGVLIYSRS